MALTAEAVRLEERNGVTIAQMCPEEDRDEHFLALPQWCWCFPDIEEHYTEDGAVSIIFIEHKYKQ